MSADVQAVTPRPHPSGLALWGGIILCVGVMGCNWLTGSRKPPKPKQGVVIEVSHHRAALYINEEPVTLLSSRKPNVIGLAPGRYRIAIKKGGFFSRYYDVSVQRQAFAKLRVQLQPELE